MPYNPSPKVADARAIAAKWRRRQVIILAIDQAAGVLEYTSYGQTAAECREAKRLADAAYEAVEWELTAK